MPKEDYAGLIAIFAVLIVFSATGLAAFSSDWNWVAVSAFAGIMALAPVIYGQNPPLKSYVVFLFPHIAFIVLSIVSMATVVPYEYEINLTFLSFAGFSLAFFALTFLRSRGYPISRKWVTVFSVSAAWAICALCTFSVFYHLEASRVPVYNWQYDNHEDNSFANWRLMLPMTAGLPAAVVYALAIKLIKEWIFRGENL